LAISDCIVKSNYFINLVKAVRFIRDLKVFNVTVCGAGLLNVINVLFYFFLVKLSHLFVDFSEFSHHVFHNGEFGRL